MEKLCRFGIASIHFAVVDARACTHGLDVAYGDGTAVLLAVAMLQLAFQWNGDNLHILMRMGSEAFSRSYPVVVQNAQRAEIHAGGVVILVKTECMAAVEPVIPKSVHGFRLCLLLFS